MSTLLKEASAGAINLCTYQMSPKNYSINVALRINFLLPATEVAVPTVIEFKI